MHPGLRRPVLSAIVVGLVMLVFAAGLIWYGTIYTHQRIREAVAYTSAPRCPETVDADRTCVKVVGAVVTKRTKSDTSDSVVYTVYLQTPSGEAHVRVGDSLYDSLKGSDEVQAWRFRGKIVAIEHDGLRWGTYDEPGPPYLTGLLGTLFWAVAFGAGALLVASRRATRFDFWGYFGALAISVGIIISGAILDYGAGVVHFDPRLIYVSLALTPAVSIVVMLRRNALIAPGRP